MYIQIDRASKTALSKQIYHGIKQSILSGSLPPEHKLPSTRALSKELMVSRNVVLEAYSQLLAEGYLYSKERSGVYVMRGIKIAKSTLSEQQSESAKSGLQFDYGDDMIDFRTGVPSLALFPKSKWGRLYRQVCIDTESSLLDYYEPSGSYELRKSLCAYLARVRGVECGADNMILTSGAAQSFSLLTQYFARINKNVAVEDPISNGIVKILRFFGMDIHPAAVDENGIRPELLPENVSPSLIFTTPSHQFPTGAVLPINRRIALIDYAKRHSSYIVEDDYDSEFRFEGYPIQSMQSLAPENIIYVGTFSKTLCPALRIGYMILPQHLTDKIKSIKYIDDLHSPILEQLTLARFIDEGYLERHVSISKKEYAKKCAYLKRELTGAFGKNIAIFGDIAGIHLMAKFKNIEFAGNVLSRLRENGIVISCTAEHSLTEENYENSLLFGFGNLSAAQIAKGVQILKNIIGT